jgi:hypothetical protein
MALDFYDLNDIKFEEKLFDLSEFEFGVMEFIFIELHKRTGIHIDFYGTCRLYSDHIKIIIEMMENHISSLREMHDNSIAIILRDIMKKLLNAANGVIIVGD